MQLDTIFVCLSVEYIVRIHFLCNPFHSDFACRRNKAFRLIAFATHAT